MLFLIVLMLMLVLFSFLLWFVCPKIIRLVGQPNIPMLLIQIGEDRYYTRRR
jgi:hypothetical protein